MNSNRPNISIQKNANGRNVLVIYGHFTREQEMELKDENFDAILIMQVEPIMEVDNLIVRVNPLINRNEIYSYKPLFLNTLLKDSALFYKDLADGYSNSIEDRGMADRIEEIVTNCQKWNIKSVILFQNMNRPEYIFKRIYRFCVTRNELTPGHKLRNGSTLGYVRRYFNETHHLRLFHYADSISFHHRMLQKGYLKISNYVNRLQVCPVCLHTHLLFMETCPKCGSSQLTEESIIHHFRCANISKESDYMVEDKLICPKCHRELRHIGVDYDRPSSLYYCEKCGNSFLDPSMKVVCTNCGTQSTPEDLIPFNFVDYTITPEGVAFFTGDNYAKSMAELVSLNVTSNKFTFMSRLEQLARVSMSEESSEVKVMVVLKVWISFLRPPKKSADLNTDNPIFTLLFNFFADCYVSVSTNTAWIMHPYEEIKYNEEGEEKMTDIEQMMTDAMELALKELAPQLNDGESFKYRFYVFKSNDNITDFTKELNQPE